jgi:hypothetical protein
MKLHKGLAVFSVRDRLVAQELQALAEHEGINIAVLTPDLIATEPEDGKKLCEVLRKRGYFPRSSSPNGRSNGQA